MKILWFSNVDLSTTCKNSGAWLYSMSDSLVNSDNINLINITQSDGVTSIERKILQSNFIQYVLPRFRLINGLPSAKYIKKIVGIVENESPDIIHIWGTESYWGLLLSRGYIKGKVLLEMQGIIQTCYDAYYAHLSPWEICRCFSYKELLLPNRWLPFLRHRFKRQISFETEIIKSSKYIAVQSEWVQRFVKLLAPHSTIFHSKISVRREFLTQSWKKKVDLNSIRIVTISSPVSYKGFNDLLFALLYLKKVLPNVQLNVIGSFYSKKRSLRVGGYERYIYRLIRKLNLVDNVFFLGALDAKGIIKAFSESDVFVQSSYVESYSLVVAEAMAYGIPSVVSYVGAMPELGDENKSISFYTAGESFMCASKVLDILESPDKSKLYSINSRIIGKNRNSLEVAVERQLDIYHEILNKN